MYYAMYTQAGDRQVTQLMNAVKQAWKAGQPEAQIIAEFREGYGRVRQRHPEISDTAVREEIWKAVEAMGVSAPIVEAVTDAYPLVQP